MPYSQEYRCIYPSMKRKYMRVVQYVADHDGCSRKDITHAIWNRKLFVEGYQSNMYANIIYLGFIEYDKKFRYHITPKGLTLLKKAYINDCAKLCMKKSA